MKLGDFDLHVVSDGTFRLDGGAMFGIIPKMLWEKTDSADERNRIQLGLNCLLIRTPTETILVDTGIGENFNEKFAFLYAIDKSETNLLRSLAALGVTREEVTRIVLTHLHFDHAGGSCFLDGDGTLKSTFPNATYYINAKELLQAKQPDVRSRGSYFPYAWELIQQKGQVVLTCGSEEIVPGVSVMLTPGHTEYHQSIILHSGGLTACFLGDLVPTPSHLKIHYVMGIDLFPKTAMESKQWVLKRAQTERWLLFFAHSTQVKAGYLAGESDLDPVEM